MANTYTWVVSGLECYPEHEGLENVVFMVHWRRQATNGEGHDGDVYGSQVVEINLDAPFTPFADLTEDQVGSWLNAAMGVRVVAEIDLVLDKQISDKINPQVLQPELPWA